MTNRSHSHLRRSPWLVAPAIAVAAVALTACSNSETSAPADATYELPAVFTGAPDPSAVDGATAGTHNAEAGTDGEKKAPVAYGFTASLKNSAGDEVGTVQLGDKQGGLTVNVEVDDSSLQAGIYKVGVTDNGACVAADQFQSAGQLRSLGGGEGGTTLTLPISDAGNGTLDTTIPGVQVEQLAAGQGSAVLVMSADDTRVSCGVVEGR
ncbi:hypothetical protein [Tomitella fengzijianii]|uniref:Superoxide dismutase copper/zinc binding domain-containing protein n=1 Tax=Tomitella fengzijianii TaxID=2597660 RepID=A0A516X5R4_9ACTN|nr:hypothetical protein [Tomitella fengzijianii]QDQ98363.1 hypothetical protein FO059_14860 [Tomitella fengzijianii]